MRYIHISLSNAKYLGVIFDSNFNLESHINELLLYNKRIFLSYKEHQ